MIRKVAIERFTLPSSKRFDGAIAALNAAIGELEMAGFWGSTQQTQSVAKLERTVGKDRLVNQWRKP